MKRFLVKFTSPWTGWDDSVVVYGPSEEVVLDFLEKILSWGSEYREGPPDRRVVGLEEIPASS